MSKKLLILSDKEFRQLLIRLSDDIALAPAYLRLYRQLNEQLEKHKDEVNKTLFWHLVSWAVRDAGLMRLAKIYDQEKNSLSLPRLLHLIKTNLHLFEDSAVRKRVHPSYAKNIVLGSHVPDLKTLNADLELVSAKNALVNKIVMWRNNFGAHVSNEHTLRKSISQKALPNEAEAFDLSDRAFKIYNRYTNLFHATTHSKIILGEVGTVESVFKLLCAGRREVEREYNEEMQRLIELSKSRET